MEFCWFAICTILAFIPWISAEEKLLYQTPNENDWGGWEATTDGWSPLNVIKVVVFCCFIQYPDYKHPICQIAAFLWWSWRLHHSNPPSVSKDTPVSRAPFLKYSGLLSDVFFPYTRVTLHSFAACSAGILFVCFFFLGGGGSCLFMFVLLQPPSLMLWWWKIRESKHSNP